MWLLYSILCALFYAIQGAVSKYLGRSHGDRFITWGLVGAIWVFTSPLLLREGLSVVSLRFGYAFLLSLVLNIVAFSCFAKAIRLAPLSITYPLLAFTPLFMIVTAWILIDEVPTAGGCLGIVAIVVGAYLLNFEHDNPGLLAPLKALVVEKGSRYMLITAALWSITAVADKICVVETTPVFYISTLSGAFFVLYGLLARPWNVDRFNLRRDAIALLYLGLPGALMTLFQFQALLDAQASYVIAIKRSGMLFSIIFGALLFKEQIGRWNRLVGTSLMMVGVYLIATG